MDDGGGFSFRDDDDGNSSPSEGPPKRRRDRLALLLSDVDLWRSPDGIAHVSVPMEHGREHLAVNSKGFREWLTVTFYQRHQSGLSGQALQETVALAEACALSSGETRRPWRRWALEDGLIYLDLGGGNPAGERRCVEISAAGWQVIAEAPVAFLRAADAKAMPAPEPSDTASWGDLGEIVNATTDDELALMWAWLLCAARPFEERGAYPILLLHGEQGTGKSGATRRLQCLIDPSNLTGRALPREERDLYVSGRNRHLIALDNLSRINDDLADSLCRIATGGGFSARALHTDGDESIFIITKPLLLNGIPSTLLHRPDLAERAVAVELVRPSRRRTDAELDRDFEARWPTLLGLLCDGISAALRNLSSTELASPPRMADAAHWAEAGAQGLGINAGMIPAAWTANRASADRALVEADDVAQAVVQLLKESGSPWKGAPGELHRRLSDLVSDRVARSSSWPKNANTLGLRLTRLAPTLRAALGIEFARGRLGHNNIRWWFLHYL